MYKYTSKPNSRGTKTHIGKFESVEDATPLNESIFPTSINYQEGIKSLFEHINALLKNKEKLDGVGISSTGYIENNRIRDTELLSDWIDQPILEDLKKAVLGVSKVSIMNDGACSALGEYYFGRTPTSDNFLYIIVGTGFGGSFLSTQSGKPSVIAMEPGYMVIPTKYKNSLPIEYQILQTAIGGNFLSQQINEKLEEIQDDHFIWDRLAEYLALSINNMSVLLTPQKVVFAGGLIEKRKFIIEKVSQRMDQFKYLVGIKPDLYLSKIKGNVSLLGALALLKET